MFDKSTKDVQGVLGAHLTRRSLLRRAIATGISVPVVAGLVAACGGSDNSTEQATQASTTASTSSSGASTPGSSSSPSSTSGAGTPPATAASGSGSTGKPIDKVVFLQGAEVRFFDPTLRFSSTDANANRNIYDPLVAFDSDFNLIPALAVKWESVDNTTWQFKLRENVKFHNGEPFNADTVVAWFTRLQKIPDLLPGQRSSIDQLPLVDHIEKVDDLTVNFITKAPLPTLLRRLTTYYSLIVPSKLFEDEGQDALLKKGVGTGPYKFVEWVKDDHLTLKANPDYWGDKPLVQELELRPVTEPSSRVASLLAGEAQVIEAVPTSSIDQINSNKATEIRSTREETRIYWCQWNGLGNEYLKKLEVRQALNYAVDKKTIIDTILAGHATQIGSCVSTKCFGYSEQPLYEYDPKKAKDLLAQAGYADGFTVSIQAALGRSAGDTEIVQSIIGYLKDVGVTLKLDQVDFADSLTLLAQHKVEGLTWGGKTIPALDADYMFNELLPEKQFGWLFPLQGEAADTFKKEQVELDEQKRAEMCADIQKWFHDQAGALFLWQADLLYGTSKKVNWKPRGDGLVLGTEMSGA